MGPCQHPQYTRGWYAREAVGGSLTTSTAQTPNEPTTPKFFQHGSGASVGQGRERPASVLLVVQVLQRVKTRPRLKHTAKPMRILPSISAEMLTIAVCTHADRAERASMVSVRTVVIVILDSRRRTSTEMSHVKTLTIVVFVRLFEQWRRDASENPM